MIDRINVIMSAIEDPLELLRKLGILLLVFCTSALITRLVLSRIYHIFWKGKTFSLLWQKMETPSVLLGSFTILFAALPYVALPDSIAIDYLLIGLRMLFLVHILLLFSRLIDCIMILSHARLEAQGKPIPVALFFFGRIIKGATTVVIITAVIPSLFFGYQVLNTLVKYIGISSLSAGAIIGLSFQPTIKDILGGFSVITQNLFTEGDWIECNVGKSTIAGRVIDITLRYTKLKRWTGSFLMVPNNTFLSAIIDNYGRAHYTSYFIALASEQRENIPLEKFMEGYKALIKAAPHIEEDKCHVTVKSLNIGKMELELHIFFNKTDDQDKIVRIHDFWQDILSLVHTQKLSVAPK